MTKKCSPADVAVKSFFLGPKAENAEWVQKEFFQILNRWFAWRRSLFSDDGLAISYNDKELIEFKKQQQHTAELLNNLITRFENEIPKFSPRYIGHMLSEISLPAFFGHFLTLLHNPNNISQESSSVGTQIENEAISYLGEIFNWTHTLGHFTSGGSIANYEAMVKAKERVQKWLLLGAAVNKVFPNRLSFSDANNMGWETFLSYLENSEIHSIYKANLALDNPYSLKTFIDAAFEVNYQGPCIFVPDHKHYSWIKAAKISGIGKTNIFSVGLTSSGKMDIADLKNKLFEAVEKYYSTALVVSVAGTTEFGSVDPVDKINSLLKNNSSFNNLWHHVDAAYGGFFAILKDTKTNLSSDVTLALKGCHEVTSITIDPHKLGFIPYSCGAFLVKNKLDYILNSEMAPYVNFDSNFDKGPFTIEGSRASTGATATWLTARTIGFSVNGLGKILERAVKVKRSLENELKETHPSIRILPDTDLNIIGLCVANDNDTVSTANKKTMLLYNTFKTDITQFYVTKTTLHRNSYLNCIEHFCKSWKNTEIDDDLVVIRICLMNPFFDSKELNVDLSKELCEFICKHLPI